MTDDYEERPSSEKYKIGMVKDVHLYLCIYILRKAKEDCQACEMEGMCTLFIYIFFNLKITLTTSMCTSNIKGVNHLNNIYFRL